MTVVNIVLSCHFIALVAYLLYKKFNPQAVLLLAGLCMIFLAIPLGYSLPPLTKSTGFIGFDAFVYIKESFVSSTAKVGLMIMVIGGFVSYMQKIGASDALVYVSLQPLSIFKRYPYLAASLVIPIGQLLFICLPSATGLGLLLVASICPVLVSLGVSRLSAVSVIVACTVFDLGPASANTARASEMLGKSNLSYFLDDQLPLTIPLTIIMMILYFFTNRYFDKKEGHLPVPVHHDELKVKVPYIYALLPLCPLLLLLTFSSIFVSSPITLDTTTAMLITLFVAMMFEFLRTKRFKETLASIKYFWEGMAKFFASVITLLVAADIFAKGLKSIGFMDGLIDSAQYYGLQAASIGIVMAMMVFASSVLTGSGSASFFSFAPFASSIASGMGSEGISIILPIQMASSMGRAASPISGVVMAASEIAKVSHFQLAKRNVVPLVMILIIMLGYYSFF